MLALLARLRLLNVVIGCLCHASFVLPLRSEPIFLDAELKPRFEAVGDTIGYGLDLESRTVFVTLNGEFFGVAYRKVYLDDWRAAVSASKKGTAFDINFGAKPFRFKEMPTRNGCVSCCLLSF